MIDCNRSRRGPGHAGAAGFTLLEVLIAIVVVAFGLLGLAGLQVFALKNNSSAASRVTATALANDMVDRMKTNFLGVVGNEYNKSDTAAYDSSNLKPSCNSGGCGVADLAANDRAEWQAKVAAALPGGVGVVCVDSTPNDNPPPAHDSGDRGCDNVGTTLFVVKIWWDDRAIGSAAGTRKYLWTAFNP